MTWRRHVKQSTALALCASLFPLNGVTLFFTVILAAPKPVLAAADCIPDNKTSKLLQQALSDNGQDATDDQATSAQPAQTQSSSALQLAAAAPLPGHIIDKIKRDEQERRDENERRIPLEIPNPDLIRTPVSESDEASPNEAKGPFELDMGSGASEAGSTGAVSADVQLSALEKSIQAGDFDQEPAEAVRQLANLAAAMPLQQPLVERTLNLAERFAVVSSAGGPKFLTTVHERFAARIADESSAGGQAMRTLLSRSVQRIAARSGADPVAISARLSSRVFAVGAADRYLQTQSLADLSRMENQLIAASEAQRQDDLKNSPFLDAMTGIASLIDRRLRLASGAALPGPAAEAAHALLDTDKARNGLSLLRASMNERIAAKIGLHPSESVKQMVQRVQDFYDHFQPSNKALVGQTEAVHKASYSALHKLALVLAIGAAFSAFGIDALSLGMHAANAATGAAAPTHDFSGILLPFLSPTVEKFAILGTAAGAFIGTMMGLTYLSFVAKDRYEFYRGYGNNPDWRAVLGPAYLLARPALWLAKHRVPVLGPAASRWFALRFAQTKGTYSLEKRLNRTLRSSFPSENDWQSWLELLQSSDPTLSAAAAELAPESVFYDITLHAPYRHYDRSPSSLEREQAATKAFWEEAAELVSDKTTAEHVQDNFARLLRRLRVDPPQGDEQFANLALESQGLEMRRLGAELLNKRGIVRRLALGGNLRALNSYFERAEKGGVLAEIVNARDENDSTLLQSAVGSRSQDVLSSVLAAHDKVDPNGRAKFMNATDKYGGSALSRALNRNYDKRDDVSPLEFVNALISAFPSSDEGRARFIRGSVGEKDTSLHLAVRLGKTDVVEALLKAYAEADPAGLTDFIRTKNKDGETVLHTAVQFDQEMTLAAILTAFGRVEPGGLAALIRTPDGKGVTAYELALNRGKVELASALMSSLAKSDSRYIPSATLYAASMRDPKRFDRELLASFRDPGTIEALQEALKAASLLPIFGSELNEHALNSERALQDYWIYIRNVQIASAIALAIDPSHLAAGANAHRWVSPIFLDLIRGIGAKRQDWSRSAKRLEAFNPNNSRDVRDMFDAITREIVLAALTRDLQQSGSASYSQTEAALDKAAVNNLARALVLPVAQVIVSEAPLKGSDAHGSSKNAPDILELSRSWHKQIHGGAMVQVRSIPEHGAWHGILIDENGQPVPELRIELNEAEQNRFPKNIEGLSIVTLSDGDSLKQEGREMDHCVGGGGYAAKCSNAESHILSIRDAEGQKLSTAEVQIVRKGGMENLEVVQNRGVKNRAPDARANQSVQWLQERIAAGSIRLNPKRGEAPLEVAGHQVGPLMAAVGYDPSDMMVPRQLEIDETEPAITESSRPSEPWIQAYHEYNDGAARVRSSRYDVTFNVYRRLVVIQSAIGGSLKSAQRLFGPFDARGFFYKTGLSEKAKSALKNELSKKAAMATEAPTTPDRPANQAVSHIAEQPENAATPAAENSQANFTATSPKPASRPWLRRLSGAVALLSALTISGSLWASEGALPAAIGWFGSISAMAAAIAPYVIAATAAAAFYLAWRNISQIKASINTVFSTVATEARRLFLAALGMRADQTSAARAFVPARPNERQTSPLPRASSEPALVESADRQAAREDEQIWNLRPASRVPTFGAALLRGVETKREGSGIERESPASPEIIQAAAPLDTNHSENLAPIEEAEQAAKDLTLPIGSLAGRATMGIVRDAVGVLGTPAVEVSPKNIQQRQPLAPRTDAAEKRSQIQGPIDPVNFDGTGTAPQQTIDNTTPPDTSKLNTRPQAPIALEPARAETLSTNAASGTSQIGDAIVSIKKGDYTKDEFDAIITPEFPSRVSTGGPAVSISQKSPNTLKQYTRLLKKGPLDYGTAVATAGSRQWPHVIHVVTINAFREDAFMTVFNATLNALRVAQDLGANSLAFPTLGMGFSRGYLDGDQSARAIFSAIEHAQKLNIKLPKKIAIYVNEGPETESVFRKVLENRSYSLNGEEPRPEPGRARANLDREIKIERAMLEKSKASLVAPSKRLSLSRLLNWITGAGTLTIVAGLGLWAMLEPATGSIAAFKVAVAMSAAVAWRPAASRAIAYSSRPNILEVEPRAFAGPNKTWDALKSAKVEALAEILALNPEHDIYFLARDAEYLYDMAAVLTRGTPDAGRIHLINVSRSNMRDPHLLDYLAQEGIDAGRLRAGAKILFVDTGFAGTIPAVIDETLPADVRGKIVTKLLASSSNRQPSTRAFLQKLNPGAAGLDPGRMHGTIVEYEHMDHFTPRSDAFEEINGRWEPVTNGSMDTDGRVNSDQARAYMGDLRAYAENPQTRLTFAGLRSFWARLRAISSKDELVAALKAHLAADPQMGQARVRDFIEEFERRQDRPFDLDVIDVGLTPINRSIPKDKAYWMAKVPAWKPILEDPEKRIPELVKAGDIQTLGSILDAVEDWEITRISLDTLADHPNDKTAALIEALADKKDADLTVNVIQRSLSGSEWKPFLPALVRRLIDLSLETTDGNKVREQIADRLLDKMPDHPEFVEEFVEKHWADRQIVLRAISSNPMRFFRPEIIDSLIERGYVDEELGHLFREYTRYNVENQENGGGLFADPDWLAFWGHALTIDSNLRLHYLHGYGRSETETNDWNSLFPGAPHRPSAWSVERNTLTFAPRKAIALIAPQSSGGSPNRTLTKIASVGTLATIAGLGLWAMMEPVTGSFAAFKVAAAVGMIGVSAKTGPNPAPSDAELKSLFEAARPSSTALRTFEEQGMNPREEAWGILKGYSINPGTDNEEGVLPAIRRYEESQDAKRRALASAYRELISIADSSEEPNAHRFLEALGRRAAFDDFESRPLGDAQPLPAKPAGVAGDAWDMASGLGIGHGDIVRRNIPSGTRYVFFDKSPMVASYLKTMIAMSGANAEAIEADIRSLEKPEKPLALLRSKNAISYAPGVEEKISEMTDWIAPGGQLLLQAGFAFGFKTGEHKNLETLHRPLALRLLQEGWNLTFTPGGTNENIEDTWTFTRPVDRATSRTPSEAAELWAHPPVASAVKPPSGIAETRPNPKHLGLSIAEESNSPSFTMAALLDLMFQDPDIARLIGEDDRQHILEFYKRDQLFQGEPEGMDRGIRRVTIALHDAGKPLASLARLAETNPAKLTQLKEEIDWARGFFERLGIDKKQSTRLIGLMSDAKKDHQHELTVPIVEQLLQRWGYNRDQIRRSTGLIYGDAIGGLVQAYYYDKHPDPKQARVSFNLGKAISSSAEKIRGQAAKANIPLNQFYPLLERFFLADAGSYKHIRDLGIFDETGTRLAPDYERKLLVPLREKLGLAPTAPSPNPERSASPARFSWVSRIFTSIGATALAWSTWPVDSTQAGTPFDAALHFVTASPLSLLGVAAAGVFLGWRLVSRWSRRTTTTALETAPEQGAAQTAKLPVAEALPTDRSAAPSAAAHPISVESIHATVAALHSQQAFLDATARSLQARVTSRFPNLLAFKISIRTSESFDIAEDGSIALPRSMISPRADGSYFIAPKILDALETLTLHEIGHALFNRFYSRDRMRNLRPDNLDLKYAQLAMEEMYADLVAMSYRNDPAAIQKAFAALGFQDGFDLRDFSEFRSAAQIDSKSNSFYNRYANVGSHLWLRYLANPAYQGKRQELLDAIARGIAAEASQLEIMPDDKLKTLISNNRNPVRSQARLMRAISKELRQIQTKDAGNANERIEVPASATGAIDASHGAGPANRSDWLKRSLPVLIGIGIIGGFGALALSGAATGAAAHQIAAAGLLSMIGFKSLRPSHESTSEGNQAEKDPFSQAVSYPAPIKLPSAGIERVLHAEWSQNASTDKMPEDVSFKLAYLKIPKSLGWIAVDSAQGMPPELGNLIEDDADHYRWFIHPNDQVFWKKIVSALQRAGLDTKVYVLESEGAVQTSSRASLLWNLPYSIKMGWTHGHGPWSGNRPLEDPGGGHAPSTEYYKALTPDQTAWAQALGARSPDQPDSHARFLRDAARVSIKLPDFRNRELNHTFEGPSYSYSFRDVSAFSDPNRRFEPSFATYHPWASALLSTIHGAIEPYTDLASLYGRLRGAAAADMLVRNRVTSISPHGANDFIEFDRYYRPDGAVIERDLGDMAVLPGMSEGYTPEDWNRLWSLPEARELLKEVHPLGRDDVFVRFTWRHGLMKQMPWTDSANRSFEAEFEKSFGERLSQLTSVPSGEISGPNGLYRVETHAGKDYFYSHILIDPSNALWKKIMAMSKNDRLDHAPVEPLPPVNPNLAAAVAAIDGGRPDALDEIAGRDETEAARAMLIATMDGVDLTHYSNALRTIESRFKNAENKDWLAQALVLLGSKDRSVLEQHLRTKNIGVFTHGLAQTRLYDILKSQPAQAPLDAESSAKLQEAYAAMLRDLPAIFDSSRPTGLAPHIEEAIVRYNASLSPEQRRENARLLYVAMLTDDGKQRLSGRTAEQRQEILDAFAEAVQKAHEEVPCSVYNCSEQQRAGKEQIITKTYHELSAKAWGAYYPTLIPEFRKAALWVGLAGNNNPTDASPSRKSDASTGILSTIGRTLFGTRGSALAGARAALREDPLNAEKVLTELKRNRQFRLQFAGKIGSSRYDSLEAQTLDQLRLSPDVENELPPQISKELFRAVVAVHQLGIPAARASRREIRHADAESNRVWTHRALEALGFSQQEVRLGSALAGDSSIMDLFYYWGHPTFPKSSEEAALGKAATAVRDAALRAGSTPRQILPILLALAKIDRWTDDRPFGLKPFYATERGTGPSSLYEPTLRRDPATGALSFVGAGQSAVSRLQEELDRSTDTSAERNSPSQEQLSEQAESIVSNIQRSFDHAFGDTSDFRSFDDYAREAKAAPELDAIRKAIENGEYWLVVKEPPNLRTAIADGGIKNAHQTESTSIQVGNRIQEYIEQRRSLEASWAGMPEAEFNQIPAGALPVYMYLVPKNVDLRSLQTSAYGSDVYFIDPTAVRGRVTFSLGDSKVPSMRYSGWQNHFIPISRLLLAAPFILDAARRADVSPLKRWKTVQYRGKDTLGVNEFGLLEPQFPGELAVKLRPRIREKTNGGMEPALPVDYIEAQIWGPVPSTTIKKVIFDTAIPVDDEVASKYRENGALASPRSWRSAISGLFGTMARSNSTKSVTTPSDTANPISSDASLLRASPSNAPPASIQAAASTARWKSILGSIAGSIAATVATSLLGFSALPVGSAGAGPISQIAAETFAVNPIFLFAATALAAASAYKLVSWWLARGSDPDILEPTAPVRRLYHGTSWQNLLDAVTKSSGKLREGTYFGNSLEESTGRANLWARNQQSSPIVLEFDATRLILASDGVRTDARIAAESVPLKYLSERSKRNVLARLEDYLRRSQLSKADAQDLRDRFAAALKADPKPETASERATLKVDDETVDVYVPREIRDLMRALPKGESITVFGSQALEMLRPDGVAARYGRLPESDVDVILGARHLAGSMGRDYKYPLRPAVEKALAKLGKVAAGGVHQSYEWDLDKITLGSYSINGLALRFESRGNGGFAVDWYTRSGLTPPAIKRAYADWKDRRIQFAVGDMEAEDALQGLLFLFRYPNMRLESSTRQRIFDTLRKADLVDISDDSRLRKIFKYAPSPDVVIQKFDEWGIYKGALRKAVEILQPRAAKTWAAVHTISQHGFAPAGQSEDAAASSDSTAGAESPETAAETLPKILRAFDGLTEQEKSELRSPSKTNPQYSFYRYANEFARQWGGEFAEKALRPAIEHPDRRTVVAIAMGGAEHLGNLLRFYALKHGLKNVVFKEVYLTRDVMRNWKGEIRTPKGLRRVHGIYEPPAGVLELTKSGSPIASSDAVDEDNNRKVENYLSSSGIFDGEQLIVVDTGSEGTTIDVVHDVAKKLGHEVALSGALVYHESYVQNQARTIESLDEEHAYEGPTKIELPDKWMQWIEGENVHGVHYSDRFQRSSEPVKRLRELSGAWQADVRYFDDPARVKNYAATMLGLADAISGPSQTAETAAAHAALSSQGRLVLTQAKFKDLIEANKGKDVSVELRKLQPILGYPIPADGRLDALLHDLRPALQDNPGLAEDIHRNPGGVVAMQLKDGAFDFYSIGKEAFESRYKEVNIGLVVAKNPMLANKLRHDGLSRFVNLQDPHPHVIGLYKTQAQSAIRLSKLGLAANREIQIVDALGRETLDNRKPAGKDAYAAWDGKQYYLLNTEANGLPAGFIEANGERPTPAEGEKPYVVTNYQKRLELALRIITTPKSDEGLRERQALLYATEDGEMRNRQLVLNGGSNVTAYFGSIQSGATPMERLEGIKVALQDRLNPRTKKRDGRGATTGGLNNRTPMSREEFDALDEDVKRAILNEPHNEKDDIVLGEDGRLHITNDIHRISLNGLRREMREELGELRFGANDPIFKRLDPEKAALVDLDVFDDNFILNIADGKMPPDAVFAVSPFVRVMKIDEAGKEDFERLTSAKKKLNAQKGEAGSGEDEVQAITQVPLIEALKSFGKPAPAGADKLEDGRAAQSDYRYRHEWIAAWFIASKELGNNPKDLVALANQLQESIGGAYKIDFENVAKKMGVDLGSIDKALKLPEGTVRSMQDAIDRAFTSANGDVEPSPKPAGSKIGTALSIAGATALAMSLWPVDTTHAATPFDSIVHFVTTNPFSSIGIAIGAWIVIRRIASRLQYWLHPAFKLRGGGGRVGFRGNRGWPILTASLTPEQHANIKRLHKATQAYLNRKDAGRDLPIDGVRFLDYVSRWMLDDHNVYFDLSSGEAIDWATMSSRDRLFDLPNAGTPYFEDAFTPIVRQIQNLVVLLRVETPKAQEFWLDHLGDTIAGTKTDIPRADFTGMDVDPMIYRFGIRKDGKWNWRRPSEVAFAGPLSAFMSEAQHLLLESGPNATIESLIAKLDASREIAAVSSIHPITNSQSKAAEIVAYMAAYYGQRYNLYGPEVINSVMIDGTYPKQVSRDFYGDQIAWRHPSLHGIVEAFGLGRRNLKRGESLRLRDKALGEYKRIGTPVVEVGAIASPRGEGYDIGYLVLKDPLADPKSSELPEGPLETTRSSQTPENHAGEAPIEGGRLLRAGTRNLELFVPAEIRASAADKISQHGSAPAGQSENAAALSDPNAGAESPDAAATLLGLADAFSAATAGARVDLKIRGLAPAGPDGEGFLINGAKAALFSDEGEFKTAWRHPGDPEHYVVKIFRDDPWGVTSPAKALARELRQNQALGEASPAVVDSGIVDGYAYLVQRIPNGARDLDFEKLTGRDFRAVEALVRNVLEPKRIVHLDLLSGNNIVIDRDRRAWIIDGGGVALGKGRLNDPTGLYSTRTQFLKDGYEKRLLAPLRWSLANHAAAVFPEIAQDEDFALLREIVQSSVESQVSGQRAQDPRTEPSLQQRDLQLGIVDNLAAQTPRPEIAELLRWMAPRVAPSVEAQISRVLDRPEWSRTAPPGSARSPGLKTSFAALALGAMLGLSPFMAADHSAAWAAERLAPIEQRAFSVEPKYLPPANFDERFGAPAEYGPQAALNLERAMRGEPQTDLRPEDRYLLSNPISLHGLKNIIEMNQGLWTPEQLARDFAKNHTSGQKAILVFVKTELCSTNTSRLCSVTTAALEKLSTPLLKNFKVYGTWVKSNPERMSDDWYAWEQKVIDTYRFEQGPGAKLIAFLPGQKTMYFTDAEKLELTMDEFEKNGGRTPKLEAFLQNVLEGTQPLDDSTPVHKMPTSKVIAIGQQAPDFLLKDLQGRAVSLKSLRGRPVLLEFWASWCPTCRQMIPVLNGLHSQLARSGVEILAINVKETPAKVQAAIQKLGIQYRVLLDPDGATYNSYDLGGYPYFILLDPNGKVMKTDEDFRKMLEREEMKERFSKKATAIPDLPQSDPQQ